MPRERLDLRKSIRTIPGYPKPGIMFRDFTPLLRDPRALGQAIEELAEPFYDEELAAVAGLEARGFILGGGLAAVLDVGFVPIRKKGKLPYTIHSQDYDLEYGTDTVEMHVDAVGSGERVLLHDDLIATGGTAVAAVNLLRRAGAEVVGVCTVIDLPDLGGSERLRALGLAVHTLVEFPGH